MTDTGDTATTPESNGGPSIDELLAEAWNSDDEVTIYERLCAIVENSTPATPEEHMTYMCALMAVATVSIWPGESEPTVEEVALARRQVGLAFEIYPFDPEIRNPVYRQALMDGLLYALSLTGSGNTTPVLNPPQWQARGMFRLAHRIQDDVEFVPATVGDAKNPVRGVFTVSLGALVDEALTGSGSRATGSGGAMSRRRQGRMEELRQAFIADAKLGQTGGPHTIIINKCASGLRQRVYGFFRRS